MSKEKLNKLTRYADGLKERLASPVPEKHAVHPVPYKQFLGRELKATTAKIETLKLVVPAAGGSGK
jgi:hypothetical protein